MLFFFYSILLFYFADASVRDSGAEALGTAMKVVTEKAIMPFIGDVEPIKLVKIKECSDKAVITAKLPKAAKAAAPAPKKEEVKPVARPAPKKPVMKKVVGGAKAKVGAKKAPVVAASAAVERELAEEEVDELAAELVAPQVIADMVDGNWKTRLSAAELFLQAVQQMDKTELPAQVHIHSNFDFKIKILPIDSGFQQGNDKNPTQKYSFLLNFCL